MTAKVIQLITPKPTSVPRTSPGFSEAKFETEYSQIFVARFVLTGFCLAYMTCYDVPFV